MLLSEIEDTLYQVTETRQPYKRKAGKTLKAKAARKKNTAKKRLAKRSRIRNNK